MSVITYTREARCSDCVFLRQDPKHKRRFVCGNKVSRRYAQAITLKTRVCDNWELGPGYSPGNAKRF
jgi:hypothetical protein